MTVAMVGAALAPSLPVLVALRAVQGLACAAIPPSVMGMLSRFIDPSNVTARWRLGRGKRSRAGGGFRRSVGFSRTCGVGGRSSGCSCRWPSLPYRCGPGFAGDRGHATPLHWPGAVCLTLGAALTMAAATTVPQRAVPAWVDVLLVSVGCLLLALFVVVSNRGAPAHQSTADRCIPLHPQRSRIVCPNVCARDRARCRAAIPHRGNGSDDCGHRATGFRAPRDDGGSRARSRDVERPDWDRAGCFGPAS